MPSTHAAPDGAPLHGQALFPEQLARTRRFSLGVPRHPAVSPDGARVLFVRTGGGDDPVGRLWLWEDGGERLLAAPHGADGGTRPVPPEERARRERARERSTGVVAYAADRELRRAVYALGGALWAVDTGGDAPFPVPAAGPVVDPRPSPDGELVAYVTGGALHVTGFGGGFGGDRCLAAPEGPSVTYGLTDHVSAESMGRLRGHWWAPDGRALLAARVDTSPVRRRWVCDPARPELPPRPMAYPAAGTPNAEVSLHLLALDGGRAEVVWDRAAFEYVVAADWDAHGPLVTVQSRDQRVLRVLAVDPATGATRVLHEQRDRHWVELVPGAPCRTASGLLVRAEESAGTRRLRVGDALTPEGLQVTGVLGADGDEVLFTGCEDPLEEHVWAMGPGAGCRRVSDGPGVHSAAAAGGTVVLDSLTPDGHTVTVLRGGRTVGRIASLAEEPVVTPRPLFPVHGARRLRSALFLPSGYDPGAPGARPLPVLLSPYAGPGMRLVVRTRTWWACVAQWFAEQGFAVLVTDGRGTPGRGPAWEKEIRGDQLTPVLEDQIDALRAAVAERPYLDTGRVAIRGWSFGGTLAAAAVLRHPEVFHAGVAGAAPTDQRMYDTHWKERYLGHPEREPENYERSSLLRDAHRLRRPLLLVHGTCDDNVAFAHTLRLSAALLAAGREHTVLPLSGAGHTGGDGTAAGRLLGFELGFLRGALGLGTGNGTGAG
ncbi:prolyl oligopeptidase family serine peptidase [Streptomyces sp. S1A]|uniref:prolyl oligopeptidase family serine peptidase n=1 Tax=Streptomyces sp. ICN903 TaxID=2964654 RepID=UPI001EDB6952|nr:prolyl oligopeptidase family serine peptidase [Streptomyces sp. ICN903]MCG3041329.1 prolyl oligopeptidase family serine peptidase [Streptomyces sp. ICN903]